MSVPISEFMLSRSEELFKSRSRNAWRYSRAASSNQVPDSDFAPPANRARARSLLDTECF